MTRRELLGAAVLGGTMDRPVRARPAASRPHRRVTEPHIYRRADWRARPPTRDPIVLRRPPDRLVIHHTASRNSRDYSLLHALELSAAIQGWHMDDRGWDDIGEQFTISRGGHIVEGRTLSVRAVRAGRHVVGAQAYDHNFHTLGIENEGTYHHRRPPRPQWRALVEACAWICQSYQLDPRRALIGHRDINDTSCPGDALYALLPRLRREVAAVLRPGRPPGRPAGRRPDQPPGS